MDMVLFPCCFFFLWDVGLHSDMWGLVFPLFGVRMHEACSGFHCLEIIVLVFDQRWIFLAVVQRDTSSVMMFADFDF